MSIALREEHEALQDSAARWLSARSPRAVVRAGLESKEEPGLLADPAWLGLHVPEALGGSGFGLLELCVVVEQAGRAMLPGPFLPTVLLTALLARAGGDLSPELLDGTAAGTVAWRAGELTGRVSRGALQVEGVLRPVLAAGSASYLLAPVLVDGHRQWCLVEDTSVMGLESLDLTRRVGEVAVSGPAVRVAVSDDDVDTVAGLLLSAEAAGIASWCLETATAHA